MKYILSFLIAFNSIAFAEDSHKIKIKEIKEISSEIEDSSTCLDEYLKHRKHLGIQLGLSPVTLAAGTAVGAVGGGLAGFGLWAITGNPANGWGDLAYMAGGYVLGITAGVVGGVTYTSITTAKFIQNQRLLKLIGESYSEVGISTEKFLEKYLEEYPNDQMNLEQLSSIVNELDVSGKLCDGSLVNPKRFKKGKRLAQRLANKSELFEYIHINL